MHLSFEDRIQFYIEEQESRGYQDGLPDEAHPRIEQLGKAPSYRRICKAILCNDIHLESLGMQKPKIALYSYLKRIEIIDRDGPMIQADLFFDRQ